MENKKSSEKNSPRNIKIKLQKAYSPRRKGQNDYQILSSQKKIENEIGSMSKENRSEFREALNKHNFDTEVFIPRTMSINKSEYKDKNYLLNELVSFEIKSKERKNIVEPLKKETNRFSKQYKLIRNENEEHQKDYLRRLQSFYKDIGYNGNSIEYQIAENIFSPSSVLDHNFGVNIQDDAYKYSNEDFKNDYSRDQKLLKRWQKGIEETKENKSRAKRFEEENEIKRSPDEFDELKEKEKEKEMKNFKFQKELDKIKNNLMEENRIRNMSKKEYFIYNRQLKRDIKNTKNLLEQLDENKNNSYFNLHKLRLNLDNNKVAKTYKILHPTQNKNYKEKIVFASLDLPRRRVEKKIKIQKVKKPVKNYLSPKFQIRKNLNEKPGVCLTENSIFISRDKHTINNDQNDSLPKIPYILDLEQDNNKTYDVENYKNFDKSEIMSEKQIKKNLQIKELDNLYNMISSNKNNFFEKYPHKSIEKYFKKYTKKKLPIINYKKGSNIHGLLDELQEIVKKNEFHKIAESSNDIKSDLINKRRLSYNKLLNSQTLDVDKIQELDEKIPQLHYLFAENLLTIKTEQNNKKNK